jgi:hypothetical protein
MDGGDSMTALEAVSIDRILAPGQHSGRQVEDLGPREIARVMVAIQGMRRDKIEDLKSLVISAADAVKNATEIRAMEFLRCEGPQQQRDQASRLAAAQAVFQAEALKAEMEACREYLKLLKDDWDTCRSINSNMRAEKNAIEGYGT